MKSVNARTEMKMQKTTNYTIRETKFFKIIMEKNTNRTAGKRCFPYKYSPLITSEVAKSKCQFKV